MRRRARRSKSRRQLRRYEEVPPWLQDNEYITTGYRAPTSWKLCLTSIFTVHNETMNVWTHLLGAMFFIGLLMYTLVELSPLGFDRVAHAFPPAPEGTDLFHRLRSLIIPDRPMSLSSFSRLSLEHLQDASAHLKTRLEGVVEHLHLLPADPLAYLTRGPLAVFLLSAITCLTFSAMFHLMFVRSRRALMILSKLDYAGICILISGTAVAAVYYGFYCDEFFRPIYLLLCSVLPLLVTILATCEFFMKPEYRTFRAVVFAALAFSVGAPLVHLSFRIGSDQDSVYYAILGGAIYISGAALYAQRIPERWFPGHFDYWFHSHSIFHICVVLAAYAHHHGLMVLYEWRMHNPCLPDDISL